MLVSAATVTVTEEGARRAAEAGPLGALTWAILALIVVLVIVVGALTAQLGRQGRVLKDASDTNRAERTQMAEAAEAEREEMARRYERLVDKLLEQLRMSADASREQSAALHRVCARLEERPCLVGARLGNGNEKPRPEEGTTQ